MIELNITFIIQLVNFLILLAVLNVIIYRPIRHIVQQRSERMADDMSEIESFNQTAREKLQDYEASLDNARKEGVEVRNSFKQEGAEKEKEIVGQASAESSQDLASTRQELESEAEDARKKLKKQVKGYAKLVADRVIVQS